MQLNGVDPLKSVYSTASLSHVLMRVNRVKSILQTVQDGLEGSPEPAHGHLVDKLVLADNELGCLFDNLSIDTNGMAVPGNNN
jgi:hypothetical protein